MKTDRELLELAAKSVGIEYDVEASKPHPMSGAWFGLWLVIHGEPNEFTRRRWNPLIDDGDALRLAVMLKMQIDTDLSCASTNGNQWSDSDGVSNDPYAATRRAIVRAAAEIGETE